jgi:hypothetical protein
MLRHTHTVSTEARTIRANTIIDARASCGVAPGVLALPRRIVPDAFSMPAAAQET